MDIQDPPQSFLCPITCEIMQDPVSTGDGHSYERTAIEQWLQERDSSPVTGAALANKEVTPNHTLRKVIEEFYANTFTVDALDVALGEVKSESSAVVVREATFQGMSTSVLRVESTQCSLESTIHFSQISACPQIARTSGRLADKTSPRHSLFVLNRLEGAAIGTLDTLLVDASVSLSVRVAMCLEIAHALQHVHTNGFRVPPLKLHHFVVFQFHPLRRAELRVKLPNFYLSKAADAELDAEATRLSSVFGELMREVFETAAPSTSPHRRSASARSMTPKVVADLISACGSALRWPRTHTRMLDIASYFEIYHDDKAAVAAAIEHAMAASAALQPQPQPDGGALETKASPVSPAAPPRLELESRIAMPSVPGATPELVLSFTVAPPQPPRAETTVHVPRDYATLRAAVAAAPPGATVRLADGAHAVGSDGELDAPLVVSKQLHIVGSSADACTLSGSLAFAGAAAGGSSLRNVHVRASAAARHRYAVAVVDVCGSLKLTKSTLAFDADDDDDDDDDAGRREEFGSTAEVAACALLVSGAPSRPTVTHCVLRGAAAGTLVVDGASATLSHCDFASHALAALVASNREGNVALSNSTLDGCKYGVWLACDASADILYSEIRGGDKCGIFAESAAQFSASNNEIHAHGHAGVTVTGTCHGGVLRSNDIHDNNIGVEVRTGASVFVQRNTIRLQRNAGIFLHDGGASNLDNNRISKNRIGIEVQGKQQLPQPLPQPRGGIAAAAAGTTTRNTGAIVIRRSHINGNHQAGVLLSGMTAGIIEDNDVYDNAYAGIEVQSARELRCSSNRVYENRQSGVFIHGDASVTLDRNEIHENSFSGIEVTNTARCVAMGNTIVSNVENGVKLQQASTSSLVHNEITRNLNGMMVNDTSSIHARQNQINDNLNYGVFAQPDVKGRIAQNRIAHNTNGNVHHPSGPGGARGELEIVREEKGAALNLNFAQGLKDIVSDGRNAFTSYLPLRV